MTVLPARSEWMLTCGCTVAQEALGDRRVVQRCAVASGLWAALLEARDAATGTNAGRDLTKAFDRARTAYREHVGLGEW